MDITARHGVYESLVNNKFSDKLIISLAGFGDTRLEYIKFESQTSIAEGLPDVSSIFIRDTSRSWYTNPDGFDGLVDFLSAFIEQRSITDVTVFGLSMGGYGAILLGKYINAQRAVALSPRTLLGKACTFDSRILEYSSKLINIRHADLLDLDVGDTEVTVIASVDIPEDAAHAARLVGSKIKVLGCHGQHNVALTLRQKNQLTEFMRDCTETPICEKKYGFFEIKSEFSTLTELKLENSDSHEIEKVFDQIPDLHTPVSMHRYLYRRWLSNYMASPTAKPFDATYAYPAHTGQVIEGSDIASYLSTGWSYPESFGAWGIGYYHVIRLKLIDLDTPSTALVVLNMTSFSHAAVAPITASIYFNGKLGASLSGKDSKVQVEALVDQSLVEIMIHTPNPASPHSIGLNDDKRLLSFYINKLAIYPR